MPRCQQQRYRQRFGGVYLIYKTADDGGDDAGQRRNA
jgi:hypothetical protein